MNEDEAEHGTGITMIVEPRPAPQDATNANGVNVFATIVVTVGIREPLLIADG
ncbi:MAG: hypothetical protein ACREEM_36375 [Blastocatellia bacterium]